MRILKNGQGLCAGSDSVVANHIVPKVELDQCGEGHRMIIFFGVYSMNTIAKTMMLTTVAVLLSSGPLSAAEPTHHQKGHQHRHYRQPAGNVSGQHASAVQHGNNTRDNSYGGVYGEYAPQPQ